MELTNKTLALVLVLSIAVSLFGMILSINRLNNTSRETITATGFASGNTTIGNATLYINSTLSITFAISSIDWGTGAVNTTVGTCTLNTVIGNSAGCIGFNTVNMGLILENDGNQNASVSINSSVAFNQFPAGGGTFMWKVSDNGTETGSCPGGYSPNTTFVNVNSTSALTICDALLPNDATDSLRIDLNVTIPLALMSTASGQRTANITATAS